MKLPEPFNGRAVGRLRADGRLVVLRQAPGPKVSATTLDESLTEIEGSTEVIDRIAVEPLTTTARDVLAAEVAEVAGKVTETMSVSSDGKGGVRRERRHGGEPPK